MIATTVMIDGLQVNKWSLRAVPLTMLWGGHEIGKATGFFWEFNSEIYLISNWHVFSGRHPVTRQPIDEYGVVPDEIVYPRFIQGDGLEIHRTSVKLCDNNGDNLWYEHPVLDNQSKIDVAAILIPRETTIDTICGVKKTYINISGYWGSNITSIENESSFSGEWSAKNIEVGEQLFILGFPLGVYRTGHIPIWKRASVASEMVLMLDSRSAFLVDTATSKGMSGSPVIHVDTRGWGDNRVERFIGIYSGRSLDDKGEISQLGVVWGQDVINGILAAKIPGSW